MKGFINKCKSIINWIVGRNQQESVPFFTKDIFKDKKYIIGEYTYGHPQINFDDAANLKIGKFCSIAGEVNIFLGGNHRVDWISTYPFNHIEPFSSSVNQENGHPSTKGDVIIGNDVWIGFGVTILSGVTIADGAAIASNSVVTKNIGPYEIWGGNPARLIKKRFDDQQISKLLNLKWWDKDLAWIQKNVGKLQNSEIDTI